MLSGLLLLTLTVPYTPTLTGPPDEGWVGGFKEFATSPYADDAGVPAASTRLEFRRDDAGYGALEETLPYGQWNYSTLTFPVEGARWCWRAQHINVQGAQSAASSERCFRTDFTPPVRGFVDAGAIVSDGRVMLDAQPAVDTLSGVEGYFFAVAPTPSGPFYDFAFPYRPLSHELYLGEGSWFGWLQVSDVAGNADWSNLADSTVPITITAANTVPTPEAPSFEHNEVNFHGDALEWDSGWMADAGVTHVVSSFCYVDAGCQWRMGFHSLPLNGGRAWLQPGDEGTVVARLAVVRGGQVGPWSASSNALIIDRTAPPVPPGLMASPSATRVGPLTVSWGLVVDDRVGLGGVVLEVSELLDGGVQLIPVGTPDTMTVVAASTEGRLQFRVASVDKVNNQSAWSAPVTAVIDSTGPNSLRPVVVAAPLDGGALVSISWSFPSDALSAVTSQELRELSADGGAQVFPVTGLAVSRVVPAGEWRWQLRATDALGNVGGFSESSNAILVTESGVAIGPSIVTTSIAGRCDEALSFALEATGDAPLWWTLLSGPPGLVVSGAGQLTWTPPVATAGVSVARVKVQNGVGFESKDLELLIACDPVTPVDAGQSSMSRSLTVGCGCASFDSLFSLALLAFALRRRR